MTDISIIGSGRLGTSLGSALAGKGYTIRALSARRLASAVKSASLTGAGSPLTDNIRAAEMGSIVFLCLPEEEIPRVVKELASSRIHWNNKFVFHCSGLLPAEVLKPLQARGASIASIHPVQSFPEKETPSRHLRGIYFGLEGEEKALTLARKIVHRLGGVPIIIGKEDKPLYHAACSIASNFLVVLLDVAVSILEEAGLGRELGKDMLLPLMQVTLLNVKEIDTPSALTGPIARGDRVTVEKHLQALRKFPPYSDLYLNLAAQALKIARRKKLPPHKIRALKKLLEEK